MIREFAPAKINLFLHVTGRRGDGFHQLESLFGFADIGDQLTFELADEISLDVTGPFAKGLGTGDDNLVVRAARCLREAIGGSAGASIILEKNVPLSSGIGGGSADAAATLRGLSRLWGVSLSSQRLLDIALSLGADVPSCIDSRGVFVSGVGEALVPSSFGVSWPILLVNPGCDVATPKVFGRFKEMALAFSPAFQPWPPQWGRDAAIRQGLKDAGNDLEAPAVDCAPEIAVLLDRLSKTEGAWLSRMSGSGATCFALMESESALKAAEISICHSFPSAWVASGSVKI